MRIAGFAVFAAALTMLVAGCGSTAQQTLPAGSAQSLVSTLSRNYHADFDPLATPRQAVDLSNLIVRGRVAEVSDGIAFQYPDPDQTARERGTFVTLRLTVTEVVSATTHAPPVGSSVYVQVRKSPTVSTEEVVRAASTANAVAMLEDITNWVPAEGAELVRPSGMPATGPFYFAFPDGLWLQGQDDPRMIGLGSELDDLAAEWGNPQTLDQLVAAIRNAGS
jgi:hypothetical protein